MLTVTLLNISPPEDGIPAKVSDYAYTINVNGYTLDQGFVRDHARKNGWRALLSLLAKEGVSTYESEGSVQEENRNRQGPA